MSNTDNRNSNNNNAPNEENLDKDTQILNLNVRITELMSLLETKELEITNLNNNINTLQLSKDSITNQNTILEQQITDYLNEKQGLLNENIQLKAINTNLVNTDNTLNEIINASNNGESTEIIKLKSNINSITQEMTDIMEKVTNDNKQKFIDNYFQPSTKNTQSDIDNGRTILAPKTTRLDLGNNTSEISNLIFANQGQLIPSKVEVDISTPGDISGNINTINAKISFTKQNVAYIDSLVTSISNTNEKQKAGDHI